MKFFIWTMILTILLLMFANAWRTQSRSNGLFAMQLLGLIAVWLLFGLVAIIT